MLKRANSKNSESEEEVWIKAACHVLATAVRPLHYTEIKCEILQRGLVAPGLITTLDSALINNSSLPNASVRQVHGKSGYFYSRAMHSPTGQNSPGTVHSKTSKFSVALKSPNRKHIKTKPKQKVVKRGNSNKVKDNKPDNTAPSNTKGEKLDTKVKLKEENNEGYVHLPGDGEGIKRDVGLEDINAQKGGSPKKVIQGDGSTKREHGQKDGHSKKAQKPKANKDAGSTKKRGRQKSSLSASKLAGVGQHTPLTKYEERYRRLKRLAKDLIFINAAYCDEVVHTEAEIQKAREHRKYLLTRLLHRKASAEAQAQAQETAKVQPTPRPPQSIAQILGNVEKRNKRKASPSSSAAATKAGLGATAAAAVRNAKPQPRSEDISKAKIRKSRPMTTAVSNPQAADSCTTSYQQHSGGAEDASDTSYRHRIGGDEEASPLLPLQLGHLIVHNLGEVVSDRPGYHTAKHLYPVGFRSARRYHSLTPHRHSSLYACHIVDNGSAPLFEIQPEGERHVKFRGNTATECHNKLLVAINQSRGKDFIALGDKGAAFFGFTHPTVQQLLQSQAQVKQCAKYKQKKVSRLGELFIDTDPAVNMDTPLQQSQSDTSVQSAEVCSASNLLAIQGSLPFAATLNPGTPGLLIPLLPNG